ncbi:MAG TPA: tetratricopeptide repeat protein [Roseiflexaceae bacterium]|nr:tetratricopeptide repeat protein [Roseiflexaceae bacterium]
MTDSTHALKERLRTLRQTARFLLEKAAAAGGEVRLDPIDRHSLLQTRAGIAQCKDELRAQGVVVDDAPEDTATVAASDGVRSEGAGATFQTGGLNAGQGNTYGHVGMMVGGNATIHLPPAAPPAAPFAVPFLRPTTPLVGRDALLADLRARLCQPEPVRLALDGMPGVGKTRLMTTLAYDPAICAHFGGGVFMATLGQQPDLDDVLRRWWLALGLPPRPQESVEQQIDVFGAALARRGGPVLIILDDVWNAAHAGTLLPASRHLSAVLTSREQRLFQPLVGKSDQRTLPPLDTADATTLLGQEAGVPASEDQQPLTTLAGLVGGLPLLLTLMGAYLAEQRHQQQTSWFARALDELQDAATRLNLPIQAVTQARAQGRGGLLARFRRPASPQALNARAIIELSTSSLSRTEREVLVRLAALPPDPVSFGLDAAAEVAERDAEVAIRVLVRRNLLMEAGDGRFRMHRVLWDWAEQRAYAEVRAARRRLADWHAGFGAEVGAEDFAASRTHPDNWQQLLQTWQGALDDLETLRACVRTIVPLLIQQAYWNQVRPGLEHALGWCRHSDAELAALIHYYLGWIAYDQARYEAAAQHAQEALRGFQGVRNEVSQASALALLGHVAEAQGAYAEALPLYKGALDIHERVLGPDHPDTASSLNSLAALYRTQGAYAEALPLYERALDIFERVLGPDHPHTGYSLNGLAGLLKEQGAYAEALPLLERVLGPDHPDTANSLNNLAALFQIRGVYAKAQPFAERALNIRERVLGANHSDTATSLNNLAELYRAQGAYTEALPLCERALDIREQVLAPDHPDTAASLNNLAGLYRQQGAYAKALPLYEQALDIRDRMLGSDHPDTAISLHNLAYLYYQQSAYAEALPLYERALDILQARLGPQHPHTLRVLRNLAALHQRTTEHPNPPDATPPPDAQDTTE